MSSDLERVTHEVIDVHIFISEWIAGSCPGGEVEYQKRFLSRLSPSFMIVMPGGRSFVGPEFTKMMFGAHGSNPAFKIKITDVAVRQRVGDVLVVTYLEWQRGAAQSSDANNARQSTAVFRDRGTDFELLHVHETWLPPDRAAAGDYDF